jgi:hypothetical protein
VNLNSPFKLAIDYTIEQEESGTLIYLCKSRAMIKTFPGKVIKVLLYIDLGFVGFFSSYRSTAQSSAVLISMDQYYRLMQDMYSGAKNLVS